MAHGLIRGPRRGTIHGSKHNGAMTLGSNALASVTRDSLSMRYVPSNSSQWTTLCSVAGISTGNPSSLWLMQEASGNLADSIDSITLTQSGTGHLYQQAVAGWTRKAIQTTDGGGSQKWINSTTAPNPNTTSTLVLAYITVPVAAPPVSRDVFALAAAEDLRLNTTGKLRAGFGASADLVNSNQGNTILVALQVNNTAAISAVYTPIEKFIGTYALPASGNLIAFGGQTSSSANIQYLYACEFIGAAAELTSIKMKSLFETMLGTTVPWS